MLKMTRRIGRFSGLIAAGVAIVGTGSGVMAASYSAFNATTANGGNSWTTGTVVLANDTGSAMFTAVGTPQQLSAQATKCIKVTSTGNLATTIKLYSTGYSDTGIAASAPLGTHINLTVNMGAANSPAAPDCSGFVQGSQIFNDKLSVFNAHTAFASGISTWAPTGSASESRVFQFIWSYDSGAPQGTTVNDTFTWEAQGS